MATPIKVYKRTSELLDVSYTGLANNDLLQYESASGLWKNKTIASVIGTISHNSLADLTTGDPHTQYALLSGRTPSETLNIGAIQLDTNFTTTQNEGQIYWDNNDKTLVLDTEVTGTRIQVGQETVLRATNKTGVMIPNGSVVYISGAQGNRPTVALADADLESTSSKVIGIATNDIGNNVTGYVTAHGIVRDLNTNAFNEGDMLWLSGTAGQFTNVRPSPPQHAVYLGVVITKNSSTGAIFVRPQNGFELNELHDVLYTGLANADVLRYDGASSLWKNVASGSDWLSQYALLTGRATPQTFYLGTGAGATAGKISATSHATKGILNIGDHLYIDEANNRAGFSVSTPTAVLHLKAGTATANTAPLKFTSGTLNAASEAGAVEFLTDDLYITNTTGTTRRNLIQNGLGFAGGQTIIGDTASGGNLTLQSTSHATKGKILFGTSAYDEANNMLGIGTTSPTTAIYVAAAAGVAVFTGTAPSGTWVQASLARQSNADQAAYKLIPTGAASAGNPTWFFAIPPSSANFAIRSYDGTTITSRLIIDTAGKAGLGGTTTPTAYVHIGAGTASANTAPLKFTSGTLNTTAEAGAMEFLTDDLYITNTTGTTRRNLIQNGLGFAGGQTIIGDTASGGNLTLQSTAHATKGKILFGTSAYDEANNRLGIGTTSPTCPLSAVSSGPLIFRASCVNGSPGSPSLDFLDTGRNVEGILTSTDKDSGGTNGFYIASYSNHPLMFGTNAVATRSTTGAWVTISTTGNVGIGTSNPVYLLEVIKNQAAYTYMNIGNTNSSGIAGILATSDLGSITFQAIGSTDVVTGWPGYGRIRTDSALNGFAFLTGGAKPIIFGISNAEVMRISNTSDVLINTATALTNSGKFQIQGAASGVVANLQANATPGNFINLQNSSGTILTHFNSNGTLDIGIATGTAPFVIASTTAVTNLNADLLDGYHETAFILSAGRATPQTLAFGTASGASTGYLTSTSHATKGKYFFDAAMTSAFDEANNRLGIGQASPTAALHLKAGTATASTAPLKFTSGTLLTAAEDGTIEYLSNQFYLRNDGLTILSDSKKAIYGAGSDMSVWYDGTNGNIKTSDVAASDLHIQCGTDKTIVLDETVWDDIIVPLVGRGGTSEPTFGAFGPSGNLYAYKFNGVSATVHNLYGTFEIPHTYKEGTDLDIHVHWTPTDTSGGNVKWFLEYSIANVDGTFGAPTTISSVNAAGTTAWKHIYSDISTTVSGSGLKIGTICNFRLYRDPADAQDTYGADAALLSFGVHIQQDTLGSRTELVK